MENNDAVTNQTENRRMLVADDDPAILRLIATILEKENYTVVTARDGRERDEPLPEQPPHQDTAGDDEGERREVQTADIRQ